MARVIFNGQIAPDRRSVEVTWTEASPRFTAQELSDLIAALGDARGQMQPPVPDLPPDHLSQDPEWVTAIAWMSKGDAPILIVRHPRYGWLSTQLTPKGSAEIARQLSTKPAIPPPRRLQ